MKHHCLLMYCLPMVEFRAANSFNFPTYLFFHSTIVMMTAAVATATTMIITTTLAVTAGAEEPKITKCIVGTKIFQAIIFYHKKL